MRTLEKDADTASWPAVRYGVMPSMTRPPANEKDAVHAHAAAPLTYSVLAPAAVRAHAMWYHEPTARLEPVTMPRSSR